MRWNWAIVGILVCMPAPRSSSQERAPDLLLLDRIKAKIAENRQRLPNYTCAETIERSRRLGNTDTFAFVDTVRLEIVQAEGKELFALPGAPQLEEKDLWALVTEGTAFGGAEFAQRPKSILLTDSPSYTYAGEQVLNGRRTFRYEFRVNLAASHHLIRIAERQARVGYRGSFWVDTDQLDLIRLETAADDIQPDFELSRETDAIEYQQTQIGESSYLLPNAAELVMIDRDGMERRSRIQFSGCRPYGVYTSAIFGSPVPAPPEAQPKQATTPAGPLSIAPAQSRIDAAPSPLVDPVKAARQELPAGILLLARIKAKAAENLQRLPNYTCIETVERTRRKREARKPEPVDTLRLEVALVDGKEMFSWPGEGKFEEKNLGEIVGPGAAISNGNFATHARSVFLSRWPTFTHTGETKLDGRSAVRYEYRVPLMFSGFRIRTGGAEAVVGYHGSFWVDADTLDLLRLEVHADDIPASLNLAEARDVMEYHRVHIGESDFLLPEASELTMIDLAGNQSRNRTRLSACRQYTGESVLRFGDQVPDVAAPAAPPKEIRLPAGLIVDIRLDTPIESGRSAIGDVVKAVVGRNVTKDGEILAPKGAVLTGRLTRLEKHKGQQDYYIVGLSFSTIEFEGARGEFHASLQSPGITQNNRSSFGRIQQTPPPAQITDPGGEFAIPGSQVSLRHGHSMKWRTEE